MKVTAIISEYNPFHNGHKYNLNVAKEITTSEYIISIMSGSFLQRGEPALFDKWSRAKMAIHGGVDLVIELPVLFSCQPAENFAYGAIKILDALGIVDYLCFGSENGNTDNLTKIAHMLLKESKGQKERINIELSKGVSYPKAVGKIINNSLGNKFTYPNNILGIEYIKSILTLKSNIKPLAIKRIKNYYDDLYFTGAISSATAIRNEIKTKGLSENVAASVPESTFSIMANNINNKKGPVFFEDFSDLILYELRKTTLNELRNLPFVKEGIEHRIKKKSSSSSTLEELIDLIKTKRYTRTFIQRTLCHALLNINKNVVICSKHTNSAAYIRVLAFNNKGRELLKEIKTTSLYPIIIKTANFTSENSFLNRMFQLDTLSTDIYNLAIKNRKYKKAKQDYFTSPYYTYNI